MSQSERSELLIATDKDSEIAFAKVAAAACQVPLKVFGKMSEAIQNLGDRSVLIVDAAVAESSTPPNLPLNQMHLLAIDSDFRALSRHFGKPPYGNFILRKVPELAESDGKLYACVLNRFFQPEAEGLLGARFASQHIEKIEFSGMAQKKYAATSTNYFLMENGFNEQVSATVGMAVDELVMNAMIDARGESEGGSASTGVHMEVGLDPNVLAINIVDPQGSLDRIKLLTHLRSNFTAEANDVRNSSKKGGAGLGITQILRSGGSLQFVVVPGKTTEAAVYFRRTKNLREIRRQAQFISTLHTLDHV